LIKGTTQYLTHNTGTAVGRDGIEKKDPTALVIAFSPPESQGIQLNGSVGP
jgi:hypothetical protein